MNPAGQKDNDHGCRQWQRKVLSHSRVRSKRPSHSVCLMYLMIVLKGALYLADKVSSRHVIQTMHIQMHHDQGCWTLRILISENSYR